MPPADRPVGVVLQKAQQHDLAARGHRLNFIQKQCAALGLRDEAAARRLGVGERAALVAEQFAFEQIVGQRAAIDRNKREFVAGTEIMQRARRELLAGPGIALDQHCGIDAGNPFDDPQRLAEYWRGAEQIEPRERAFGGFISLLPAGLNIGHRKMPLSKWRRMLVQLP